MPIIETEQQTNQNVISGQEYLDAGATKELVGQLRGYAEGYNDGYDAGAAAGGGSATAYAWVADQIGVGYTDFAIAPEALTNEKTLIINDKTISVGVFLGTNYAKISDTSFSVGDGVFTRDSTKDFTLWQLPE